mmetsp:Transcript_20415/g.30071  ORF Transcript_20415/g.30071 Transcript_20415/m.30071 type:complete len:224 (-) Transcript_20415:217-888(-)
MGDTEEAKPETFDEDNEGPKETGGPSLLVYYNAISRLVMAGLLICAGAYTNPTLFSKTPPGDFTYCAVFFIAGTSIFVTVTSIDLMGTKGNGFIAAINSSLYVIAACSLLFGSIFFYPGVNTTAHPIGQYAYIVGTLVVCFAVLWDIARLLLAGNAVPLPFIVALFSALVGAMNFNYGANFLMPEYISNGALVDPVGKGANFFVTGGVCFAIHALAVIKAYLL